MKSHFAMFLALSALGLLPQVAVAASPFEDCVYRAVTEGDSNRTAAQIRGACEASLKAGATTDGSQPRPLTALEERLRAEYDTAGRGFTITTHQPNYALVTYNTQFDPDDNIYDDLAPSLRPKKEEVKFQVSAKFPVWRNMFGRNADMYFGYTQTSWWQWFADDRVTSAPFRETNYEPELFVRHFSDVGLPFNGRLAGFDLGVVHQSNGQTEALSRSWNRVMGRVALDYGSLLLMGRLWWRLPEKAENDDNPGEYRYLGYGDIRATWAPNRNTFSAMWRPGTEKSGGELTWSYPITSTLRVYAQWWYGYGESLIDYDQKVNRFGIGVAINDVLMRD